MRAANVKAVIRVKDILYMLQVVLVILHAQLHTGLFMCKNSLFLLLGFVDVWWRNLILHGHVVCLIAHESVDP